MSGLIALLYRDRQPLDFLTLEKMLQALAHRGPDGSQLWGEGSVGLGHCMLWTTPESLQEHLPWTDPQSGITITADARLDNRDELSEALELDQGSNPCDGQLILLSYLKWGLECPERLLGDFAFSIWDPRHHHVYCARDPMGVKPLYYYCSELLFATASEIQSLLVHPQIPRQVNEIRIADYFVQTGKRLNSVLDDREITAFRNIYPLAPGQWIRVSPERMQKQTYWQLDPRSELKLGSDQDYAEAFRDLFAKAVQCRLRSAFPVGIQLSGGLDSSSVACMAGQFVDPSVLTAFSAIFPSLKGQEKTQVDERKYLQIVLEQGGFQSVKIEADRLSPLRDRQGIYLHPDEPFYPPNLYLTREIYQVAREQQIRVVLDGIDGDSLLCPPYRYLLELAQSGQWLSFAQEVRLVSSFGFSAWNWFWFYFWRFGLKQTFIRGPVRSMWQHLQKEEPAPLPLMKAEFGERLQHDQRLQMIKERDAPWSKQVRGEHYLALSSGLQQSALQSLDRIAAREGVEARHPFFDRRLLEFCLALPVDQLVKHGWSRIILRRAMKGIVPDAVRWRHRKANLSASFCRGFWVRELELIQEVFSNDLSVLEEFLDLERVQEIYERCLTSAKRDKFSQASLHQDIHTLWVIVTLALWLKNC